MYSLKMMTTKNFTTLDIIRSEACSDTSVNTVNNKLVLSNPRSMACQNMSTTSSCSSYLFFQGLEPTQSVNDLSQLWKDPRELETGFWIKIARHKSMGTYVRVKCSSQRGLPVPGQPEHELICFQKGCNPDR